MNRRATRAEVATGASSFALPKLLLLVVLFGFAASATGMQPQAQADEEEFDRVARLMDPTRPIESLADWDAVLGQIDKYASSPDARDPQNVDISGRTWADFWGRYVLLPAAKSRLDELRALARKQSAAGDERAVAETLAQATPLLNAQKYRAMVVLDYGSNESSLLYQRAALKPWLDRAKDADRKTAEATVQSAQTALLAAVEESVQSGKTDLPATKERLNRAVLEQVKALNSVRLRLIEEQSSLPNPIPIEPVIRTEVCPERVPPATDRSAPGLAKDFPSTEDYYPRALRNASISGGVVVRVTIADSGCVLRAAIETTSGSQDLDWAGLQLAMAGHYVAGSRDGQAVPGEFKFRINFEIYDGKP